MQSILNGRDGQAVSYQASLVHPVGELVTFLWTDQDNVVSTLKEALVKVAALAQSLSPDDLLKHTLDHHCDCGHDG
jgi:hypothetical protein